MIHTSIPTTPAIGDELYFRQADFNEALSAAKSLYPALQKAIATYNDLAGPDALTTDILNKLVTVGPERLVQQFQETIREELNRLQSPFVRGLASKEVGTDLAPLTQAVSEVKDALRRLNQSGYRVSITDYRIVNGNPEFIQDGLKEQYTVRIQNERQAQALGKLQELVACYNGAVELIEEAGFHFGIRSLFGLFVQPIFLGHTSIGVPLVSSQIEINTDAIPLL